MCDYEATEAIESAFNVLLAHGTEIDSMRNIKGEPLRVSGYFNALPEDADIRVAATESLRIYGFPVNAVKSIESRAVEQTDWLAEWKKHWKPTEIGRFIIAPPWEKIGDTEKFVISIEPNMAFGTGTHETTQLCLKAIGELYRPVQSFLDVGTGTGILAIAAAKLATENKENTGNENKNFPQNSVAKILAYDTDADSVKIAKENAIANCVEAIIEFSDGSIGDETPVFDFVCANLTIDVIVPILPLLLAKSQQTLLLSGILCDQKEMISSELSKFQISNCKFESAGDWVSVIVKKEF